MSLGDLKAQFIHERSLGLPLLSVLRPSIADYLIAEIDQRSPQELTAIFIKSWSISLGGFVPLSEQFISGHIQCHFRVAGIEIGDDVEETARHVANLADAVQTGRCALGAIPDGLICLRVHCVVEWWVRMIINLLAGVKEANRPFGCDQAAALLLTEICLEYCEYALKRLNRTVRITAFNEIALERLGTEDAVAFYESEANCPLPAASCPLRNSSKDVPTSSESLGAPSTAGGEDLDES